jgi:hypothetical protein
VASSGSGSSCICPEDAKAILTTGAIIGIAIGSVVFLILLVVLIRFCFCIPDDDTVVIHQREVIVVKEQNPHHHHHRAEPNHP